MSTRSHTEIQFVHYIYQCGEQKAYRKQKENEWRMKAAKGIIDHLKIQKQSKILPNTRIPKNEFPLNVHLSVKFF